MEHVACMGERRNAYKILDGKPKGKRPLARLRIDGEYICQIIWK
jgi:hypothetical protein